MVPQAEHLQKSEASETTVLINPSASSANHSHSRPPKAELAGLHLPVFAKKFLDLGFSRYVPKQPGALVSEKLGGKWSRLRL